MKICQAGLYLLGGSTRMQGLIARSQWGKRRVNTDGSLKLHDVDTVGVMERLSSAKLGDILLHPSYPGHHSLY